MRILVLSFQSLGNAVLTIPLLANLRRSGPGTEIHVVCHGPAAELFASCPYVDRTLIYDKLALRGSSLPERAAFAVGFLARARAGRYDAVVDLHGGPRSALIALCSGAPVRVGYANSVRGAVFNRRVTPRKLAFDPAQPPEKKSHEVDHMLDFARAMGIEPEPLPIEVFPAPGPAAPPDPPYAVLHAGSSDPRKNWPIESFVALARGIESRLGLAARFSLGPTDEATGAALARAGIASERICRPEDFPALVSLLDGASVFVGNDTGPMHVAAALGRPVVAIFGPTDEAFTAPRGPAGSRARVAALDLPCRPCLKWQECVGRECLRNLEPDAVLDLARQVLADNG